MRLKIYEIDTAHVFSAPTLASLVALKKITDIDMLLMVEKGIRGGTCHAIYQFVKTNNKYINLS